ncbi:head-tail connector protein [Pseudomonas syringae group sp. J309-1]|uniref:head-tail connector protein n=1 Tax=Pseudomonas syringae group sp. J309-1 TaxID=3079588 RepID=UPI00290B8CAE|nr:head-tail connector protein [Pseudomonas syringae group sp. J309-1]MDU8357986.1 head-tail connector protein [Pseudomonas syringae group sp. J309-1]
MGAIPIDVAMQHLRAEDDDRSHVELLLEAAEDSASHFMNRRFFADAESLATAVLDGSSGESPVVITPSIRAACLLILGSLYSNREDVVTGTSFSELPMGSKSLLTPFRVGRGV